MSWVGWFDIMGSSTNQGVPNSLGGIVGAGGSAAFMSTVSVRTPHTNQQRLNFAQGARFRFRNDDSIFDVHYHFNTFGQTNLTPGQVNQGPGLNYASGQTRMWDLTLFLSESEADNVESVPNNSWVAIGTQTLRTIPALEFPNVALLFPAVPMTWNNWRSWNSPHPHGSWVDATASFTIPVQYRDTWRWLRANLTLNTLGFPAPPLTRDVDLVEHRNIFQQEYRPMATRSVQNGAMRSLDNDGGFLDTRNASGVWTPMPLLQHDQEAQPNVGSSQTRHGTWVQQALIGVLD